MRDCFTFQLFLTFQKLEGEAEMGTSSILDAHPPTGSYERPSSNAMKVRRHKATISLFLFDTPAQQRPAATCFRCEKGLPRLTEGFKTAVKEASGY